MQIPPIIKACSLRLVNIINCINYTPFFVLVPELCPTLL